MSLLCVQESGHEQAYFSLWDHLIQRTRNPSNPVLSLLADFHYAHGTWTTPHACELCHREMTARVYRNSHQFLCSNCAGHRTATLDDQAVRWFHDRYVQRNLPLIPRELADELSDFLFQRLSQNVCNDSLSRKILKKLFQAKDSC